MNGALWTDWQIEMLKAKLLEGWSASQIAAVLVVSKNAVIGKVHRLGLGGGKRPLSMNSDAVWSRAKRAKAKGLYPIPLADIVVEHAPAAERPRKFIWAFRSGSPTPPSPVSLGDVDIGLPAPGCVALSRRSGVANAILHRRNIECVWPIGAVEKNDFHFCSAHVRKLGEPYCSDHMHMAVGERERER